MSGNATKRWVSAYFQDQTPTSFFRGLFRSPSENFFNSESVELDIVRSGEPIAIAVQGINSGYRLDSADIFTNKEFIPPVFKEGINLDSGKLLKRRPGSNPFADFSYRANIVEELMRQMRLKQDKLERALEHQGSQVMQTGTYTSLDESGATIFAIDYKPKATHFPTSGTAWDAGGDVFGDLLSLANVIRDDGLVDSKLTVWGDDALEAALTNTEFKAAFDNRRIDRGSLELLGGGGTGGANFWGVITVGGFKLELWTYSNRYEDPQSGNTVNYLDPAKVLMMPMPENIRLDGFFGGVPNIGRELGMGGESLLAQLGLPTRFGSTSGGMDIFVNAWLSENKEQINAGMASRPLLAPIAIDRYGCLDTGV